MNNEQILKNYKKKIDLLKKYNKNYYDLNKALIDDAIYDLLKKEILDLEKRHSFLKHKDSPTANVGYKPSKTFKKAIHKVPMLSLGNAFSEDDLINFEKKILNYLNEENNFKIE